MHKLYSLFALLLTATMSICAQAPTYTKVRLQFSETNANGTTVSVVDQAGQPIEGATATLEAIEKQDGSNAPVSTTLQTANAHLLTPVYTNAENNGWVLTFKLNGLQGQFNKALVDLHAMNAGGGYQNDANIKYWTANLCTGTDLEDMTDFGTSEQYGISDPKYQDGNTRHVEATIPGNEVTEFTNDMYVKLHVVKVKGGGCFCGLQYIDFPMYNPDAKFTTITWNLKDSEGNIKATDTHENCEEGTEVSAQFAYPFLTIDGETTTTAGKEDQTIDLTYTENYPFAVTTDATSPVYGKLHGHSNQNRYIYLTEEGMGHDTTTEPEEFTDNYMWYITGNCFEGFQLWNKAFPGQPLKATTPVASVNEESEASSLWQLREGRGGSKFADKSFFTLWQEGVTYLNCQGDLKYWQNADEGSTFYFEEEIPEPEDPFTVAYDGDETITITPKDPEATYFWGIANNDVMGLLSYTNVYDFFEGYLLPYFWEEDMCTGEITMTDTEYSDIWQYGLTVGLNYILVANGYWDAEANEGEGGAVRTGDIEVYEITTGEPTGVGTVLNQQASKSAYNLQGKLVNKLQRGIMIQNGKKVLR